MSEMPSNKERKSIYPNWHAVSEEPGMEYLTNLIANNFPHIPVHYIKEKPLFQII